MAFPKQKDVEVPLLLVLDRLGGSAAPQEVYPKVATFFPLLTEEDQEERLPSSSSARKWWNLVQWARQTLVGRGELDGSTRGVWAITEAGRVRVQQDGHEGSSGAGSSSPAQVQVSESTLRDLVNENTDEVKKRLLTELQNLSPEAFENFCSILLQRLFRDQQITKRGADGGLDGYGDFRQGAVSIKSAFQAKRWVDSPVVRPEIDKFRGAIQGDFDHGVFLTTSRFTRDAAEVSFKKGGGV